MYHVHRLHECPQVCVLQKGEPRQSLQKEKNIVHSKPKAKTCHYCMKKGHTSYKCYVRRFEVPKGKCVWIPKDLIVEINPIRSNLNWVLPLSN